MFVTTNFDRLLERALAARGVEPVVVSDDATLVAAPRREHSDVFIVKAHGDYLQETIRNTPSELAALDAKLTDELRAIVDHYGLLVLGWSGSDPALAEIVRGRTSRYGAWWLSRSESPVEPARTLVETIGARTIVRPGAADFLVELDRRLAVYQAHESGDDPGSVHDQVLGLVKRADEVELDELLRRERYAFESAVDQNPPRLRGSGRRPIEATGGMGAARRGDRSPYRLGDPARCLSPGAARARSTGPRGMGQQRAPDERRGRLDRSMAFPVLDHRYDACGTRSTPRALRRDPPSPVGRLDRRLGLSTPVHSIPGDFGRVVAANFGPKPPEGQTWTFAEWQWLVTDLQSKEWLVECQATFAVLMSRFRRGLSVLRLRQWMYRRMRRAWVAWSGWSVPASVKYRSARNCASILFSQEA